MSTANSFFGSSQNAQPGTVVPPFPVNSADNGLSVDPITGRIVLGNDIGGTGAELLSDREIEMDNFRFRFVNGGNEQLNIDPLQGRYMFGDVDDANTGTKLNMEEVNSEIRFNTMVNGVQGAGTFLIDGVLRQFAFGELDQNANGLRLAMDDIANTFRIEDITELKLFFAPSVYSMGNVNDTQNGSKISVDDLNDSFAFSSIARGRMMALSGITQRYEIGDLDGLGTDTQLVIDDSLSTIFFNGNGGIMLRFNNNGRVYEMGDISAGAGGLALRINDGAGLASLDNTAGNAGFEINGVAGFTGTVAVPTSITVNGGIVTNVT